MSPIAFHLGPLPIRWYALAYIAGIVLGWFLLRFLARRWPLPNLNAKALDDLITYAVAGIILGGRLGYVLFYKPLYYLENPLSIPLLWEGGMSFHGGFLGVLLATWLFCRRHRIPYMAMMDRLAVCTPIGLFFGRLANFVNGELYGRVTDVSWGVVFETGGPLPRHPSQLYEAGLEGLLLFAVLLLLTFKFRALERPRLISGAFLIGYGLSRILVECVREPDAHLGFILGPLTMGQLLCLPMLAAGVYFIVKACKREPAAAA